MSASDAMNDLGVRFASLAKEISELGLLIASLKDPAEELENAETENNELRASISTLEDEVETEKTRTPFERIERLHLIEREAFFRDLRERWCFCGMVRPCLNHTRIRVMAND